MAAQVAQISLVDALHAALFARDPVRAQSNEERMVNAILPKSL
jgi:DNA-binding MurR/RpiR family transcriptional regulator